MTQVLIVEDDKILQEALIETLSINEISAIGVADADSAITLLGKETFQLVITDVNLSTDTDGIALLKTIKQSYSIPVLVMTAFGNIAHAIQAIRLGAVDYLVKPFEPEKLVEIVKQNLSLLLPLEGQPIFEDVKMKHLYEVAYKAAQSDISIFISGESGTGKEVLARYIHAASKRHKQPFVALNCAAIPENMLEALLFGFEKGAFTGAHQSTPGKFELADKGTILLDEISEMPYGLQAKLLRVIQDKCVERIGARKPIQLDVRIISASNRDIKHEVVSGRFREDLFYRLSVFPLHLLPLRERRDDIIPIAEYLLNRHASINNRQKPNLTNEAMQWLQINDWPGNVRQLENVIQRALVLQDSDIIQKDDLVIDDVEHNDPDTANESESLGANQQNHEYQIILQTLKKCNGNRGSTAHRLGISERTLRYKMAKMKSMGYSIPESKRTTPGD